jgi:hypothetical protein
LEDATYRNTPETVTKHYMVVDGTVDIEISHRSGYEHLVLLSSCHMARLSVGRGGVYATGINSSAVSFGSTLHPNLSLAMADRMLAGFPELFWTTLDKRTTLFLSLFNNAFSSAQVVFNGMGGMIMNHELGRMPT